MLIGAVRGGHVEIVRALLHKYADIDIRGQVRTGDKDQASLSAAQMLYYSHKGDVSLCCVSRRIKQLCTGPWRKEMPPW